MRFKKGDLVMARIQMRNNPYENRVFKVIGSCYNNFKSSSFPKEMVKSNRVYCIMDLKSKLYTTINSCWLFKHERNPNDLRVGCWIEILDKKNWGYNIIGEVFKIIFNPEKKFIIKTKNEAYQDWYLLINPRCMKNGKAQYSKTIKVYDEETFKYKLYHNSVKKARIDKICLGNK